QGNNQWMRLGFLYPAKLRLAVRRAAEVKGRVHQAGERGVLFQARRQKWGDDRLELNQGEKQRHIPRCIIPLEKHYAAGADAILLEPLPVAGNLLDQPVPVVGLSTPEQGRLVLSGRDAFENEISGGHENLEINQGRAPGKSHTEAAEQRQLPRCCLPA